MRHEDESRGPVIRDRRRIDPATGQVRDPGEAEPQRDSAPAGGQSRPGRHSVSRPGGGTAASSASAPGHVYGARGAAARGASPAGGPGSPGGRWPTPGPGAPRDAAPDSPPESGRSGDERPDPGHAPAEAAAGEAAGKLAERTADLQRLQAEYANYRKRVERDRLAVREQALANVLNELVPVLDDIGRAREHGELTGGFKSVAESLEAITGKLGLTSFGEAGEPFDPTLHEALMHSYSAEVTEPTAVQILQPGYRVGERIIRPARVAVAEPGGDDAETSGAPEAEAAGAGTTDDGDESDAGPTTAAPDDMDEH